MSIEQKEETENSKKLLNRKTKRDNNNNNKESSNSTQLSLKNEIMCSICLDFERFSTKCYKCISCSSFFHLECYNLFIFSGNEKEYLKEDGPNLDNFKCSRCKEEEKNGNNTKITCHLCVEHNGILKHLKDNLYIHHYCYVFFKDKLHQVKGVKGGKCNNCKIKNLPIFKCESSGCKNKFHIKCALEKGLIFSLSFLHDNQKEKFDEKIPFYCEVHGKDSIENYSQYITAMTQSMDDKKENPKIKGLQNENENENEKNNNDLNKKDKENINDNTNENNQKNDENEKEKPINSIDSNSVHGENYGSSNLSEEASEKTPVNHYHIKEKDNSISSNKQISNDNNNENKNENSDIGNGNDNKNNENKKENETLNNENNEEEVDIMLIEDENRENKNENSNNENNSENDIDNIISSEKKDKEDMEVEYNDEENIIEDYKPPEIKHEIIDLFENFNNMIKDYCFPGSFFKFKNIC